MRAAGCGPFAVVFSRRGGGSVGGHGGGPIRGGDGHGSRPVCGSGPGGDGLPVRTAVVAS